MIIVFIAVLYWLVVVIPNQGHCHDNFIIMIISTQITNMMTISTSGVGE